jgi:hypothetical protein
LAQIATTKATTPSPTDVSFSSQLYGQRDRIAVLFGPYVAYDGLAATAAGTTYNYIYVPPHTITLQWTGRCPFLSIEYYVNDVFITGSFVGPATSSPVNGYCNYDVSSTVLQLRARDYVISRALSKGGGIMVSVVYRNPLGFPFVKISFNGNLEIVYDRWIEPFHSNYIDRGTQRPFLEWGVTLLLNTYQVLGSINATAINVISELRSSTSQLVLSLAHNWLHPVFHICGAEWVITVPVSGPKVYYGNELVEKPWWAALGLRVLDSADWFITLSGISGGKGLIASILVKVAQNIFSTASATVSIRSSNGIYTVRWMKGWAESPPHTVVITLDRELSSTPRYTEWRYFSVGRNSIAYPGLCPFTQYVVDTNMYLSPRTPVEQWARAKIWTWRGQTGILTGPLEAGSR